MMEPEVQDDLEAMLAASPVFPPPLAIQRKPLIEMEFELKDVNPEFIDIILYGQSPGPHITLGEN